MNFIDFIQTNIFVTALTLLITLATCIISEVHGYRKMKIENFNDIYKCLDEFAKKRSKILDKCKKISEELAAALPEKWDGKTDNEYMKKYHNSYHGINEIVAEYSKVLVSVPRCLWRLQRSRFLQVFLTHTCSPVWRSWPF